jgi:hypothetical protein
MSFKNESANQPQNQQSRATNSGHAVELSGPKGGDPGTAGPGPTAVRSNKRENRIGHLDPSAPENANTTPGSGGEK